MEECHGGYAYEKYRDMERVLARDFHFNFFWYFFSDRFSNNFVKYLFLI